MAILFGSIAGVLLMLAVSIFDPITIFVIAIGGVIGSCLIAPQIAGKTWLKK